MSYLNCAYGFLLIINYASSWKFGTRTGSLPSQKTTFHEDGFFKFELSNFQIIERQRRCMVYPSFAILYICAYHYPSNLSSMRIYDFLVGPPIFLQCWNCSSSKCFATRMKKRTYSFYNTRYNLNACIYGPVLRTW